MGEEKVVERPAKALLMEERDVISAVAYESLVVGEIERSVSRVDFKGSSRRPMIPMDDAPARAKDFAIEAPIPVPPPVITTVLPAAERAGFMGEIAG